MSLDATETRLTKIGRIVMEPDGSILVSDFDSENCSCRDVCTLALSYAIERLARELTADIEKPGGSGNVIEATRFPD